MVSKKNAIFGKQPTWHPPLNLTVMKQNDAFALAKNYLRTTIRNISKNKVYSALNIMGLALGIAACLFILQYVSYERSYDKFHTHNENLYRG